MCFKRKSRKANDRSKPRTKRASPDSTPSRSRPALHHSKTQESPRVRSKHNLLPSPMVPGSRPPQAHRSQLHLPSQFRRPATPTQTIRAARHLYRLHLRLLPRLQSKLAWRILRLLPALPIRGLGRGEGVGGLHPAAHAGMPDVRCARTEDAWMQPHDLLQMRYAFLLPVRQLSGKREPV